MTQRGDHGRARVRPADWMCAHCGQSSPVAFDVCWNCGATRDGQVGPRRAALDETGLGDPPRRQATASPQRTALVSAGVVIFALAMLRAAGSAAIVLTPVSYLYFVLFSPKDRPSGVAIVNILFLLAVASWCTWWLWPAWCR